MTRKLAEMGCVSSKPAEEDASRGKDIHGKDFGKHGVQVSPKPLAKEPGVACVKLYPSLAQ